MNIHTRVILHISNVSFALSLLLLLVILRQKFDEFFKNIN